MYKYLLILVLSTTSFSLVGCKDTLEQITGSTQAEAPDDIYRQKLMADLKAFDRIRTQQNSGFFELEDKFKQAAKKETSTTQIRQELTNFANNLAYQNDRFKISHFQTIEVAKLRNVTMQLHYATIQIIQVIDNPNTVNNRLKGYLNKQRSLINQYNKLRADIEMKL